MNVPTPVSQIKLPKPQPKPALVPESSVGAEERKLVRDFHSTGPSPSTVQETPPIAAPHRGPMGDMFDYSEFLLPPHHRAKGYSVYAFESPHQSQVVFEGPNNNILGRAHLDHPADDPDANVSHRFEVNPKILPEHQYVVVNMLARATRHHLYGPPASPMQKAEGKKFPEWLGRPVVNDKDSDQLEMAAAIHEFQDKMPRDEAENKAHTAYRREHHLDAAAHHLAGMKAAQSANQIEDAQKHGTLYAFHLKSLGHDPHEEIPGEVKSRFEDAEREKVYRFKAHRGDLFLLDKKDELAKTSIYIGAILRKGDLVHLNPPPPTGKIHSKPAEVVDARQQFGAKKDFDIVARGEPPEPKLLVQGVGGGKNQYDYTHLLPPAAQAQGHRAILFHSPGQYDDFMQVHLYQGDQPVANQWAYPHSAASGGSASGTAMVPNHALQPYLAEAIRQHGQWNDYHSTIERQSAADGAPQFRDALDRAGIGRPQAAPSVGPASPAKVIPFPGGGKPPSGQPPSGGGGGGDDPFCPDCKGNEQDGHDPSCPSNNGTEQPYDFDEASAAVRDADHPRLVPDPPAEAKPSKPALPEGSRQVTSANEYELQVGRRVHVKSGRTEIVGTIHRMNPTTFTIRTDSGDIRRCVFPRHLEERPGGPRSRYVQTEIHILPH